MAEDSLKANDDKYRIVFDGANDAIFIHDMQSRILEVNATACERLGYRHSELLSMTVNQVHTSESGQYLPEHFQKLRAQGHHSFESVQLRKDGMHVPTEVNARPIEWDGEAAILSICRDLTERKRAESYWEMSREVLQILNDSEGAQDYIKRVLEVLKARTGFDAVGIRLQDGDDFPYIDQQGFSQDFYQMENTLVKRGPDGHACRDENDKVMLAGTCGLVISGKYDSDDAHFTPGGSYWVNDSLYLLDTLPLAGLVCCRRNQCIYHNYSSYALVPIRNKERIVGLIHFSDRRKGCFTLNTIEILEGIASHIGTVLVRKQAEEDLLAEQKRLADVIEFLPDATLAIDAAGRVIIWNKAIEEMTGIPAEEMIGKGNYAYAVPFLGAEQPLLVDMLSADIDEIKARYPLAIREGDTLVAQMFCTCLCSEKGTWYFAKASPLRDQFGNIVGAIESIRNISDSKQTEEELRKVIARFKALFNATSDSVILVQPNGMILDLNENAAGRRNVAKSLMRGQSLFDFLPPETAAVRRKAIEQILNEKRLIEYDETRNDKHYRIRLFPVMDDQGNVVQVASFSKDITESKQADEENKRLQAQLTQSQKMEAIGTLAGGIAHDFNNILSAILGNAEMARGASLPGSSAAQYLDKVMKASHRAASLVKQILTFGRRAATERVALKPAAVVEEAIKLLRPSLPSTIEVKLQIHYPSGTILADPTEVHQIIMNLSTNAFHAMEQAGGTLDISLMDCKLTRKDLRRQPKAQPGSFVVLSVGDTGPGIGEEIRDKIFDPYFTTKGVGKGTGLGLAIVHGIVTSYGGFITCESEPGKGTVFRVHFPAIKDEVFPEAKPVERVLPGRERILFVDDEEMLTDLGKVMLEQLGYEVTTQTSSLDALAAFQDQPNRFDAVITDQTMPNLTGMELTRRILHIRPDIPIIVCTGYSTTINEEQAKAEGVREFAIKPLTKNMIATLLRKILDEEKEKNLI
jgi:PAS domain S-box-containing protein